MNALPLVSIGMPVYNGERTLAAAIESILAQTWPDWELVISDNCSTDATEAICRGYAAGEPRIRYLRQPVNQGAHANFRCVLDQARGEYFMWAAADDLRSADFIEVNLSFLRGHPDYASSCSPVRLEGASDARYVGDSPVTGSRAERILGVIPAHANGRFYALFRRSALLDCREIVNPYLGSDWSIMVHVAAQGALNRVEKGWTVLGSGGASRSGNLYRGSRRDRLDFWLPFATFSRFAWSHRDGFSPAQKLRLLGKLAHLNAFGFIAQAGEALRRARR